MKNCYDLDYTEQEQKIIRMFQNNEVTELVIEDEEISQKILNTIYL